MKINSYSNINQMANTKNVTNAQSLETPKSVPQQDKMKVSGNAQMMQKMLQKVQEIPDIREEKIQEITARIESGQFEINSDNIARKMLGF
ncbi:MAG: flagellar biosynthesis anti-sigma factor FlgM [Peptococcaceae bacterium]|nr:flagellar biosynthesis anti-sigma factor FlgM [Peptococcaceae bacterium]